MGVLPKEKHGLEGEIDETIPALLLELSKCNNERYD